MQIKKKLNMVFSRQLMLRRALCVCVLCGPARTDHPGGGILGAVGEGGRDGGRAALVVVGVLAVVDGRVDGDGPHAGCVAVAVAVVVLTTVSRGPDVDVAQPVTALEHTAQTHGRRCSSPYEERPETQSTAKGRRGLPPQPVTAIKNSTRQMDATILQPLGPWSTHHMHRASDKGHHYNYGDECIPQRAIHIWGSSSYQELLFRGSAMLSECAATGQVQAGRLGVQKRKKKLKRGTTMAGTYMSSDYQHSYFHEVTNIILRKSQYLLRSEICTYNK